MSKLCRARPEDYTAGWICALPIELAAARRMLDEIYEDSYRCANDTNIYTLGRIDRHHVVVTCLPYGQMGTNSAAAVAARMKSTFPSIELGLMVGIGGGVPCKGQDVRLGDVVVSRPGPLHGGVIQYDFGKTTESGFQRTGFLNSPSVLLLNAIAKLEGYNDQKDARFMEYVSELNRWPEFSLEAAGPDLLFEAGYSHVGGDTCEICDPKKVIKRKPRDWNVKVHYGAIASGNQVMRDAIERDKVSSDLGGVLCFEMEAAGLMNTFPCLVIRGICDYADSHKNKRWQPYAAGTAAAYAKEVLSVVPPPDESRLRVTQHGRPLDSDNYSVSFELPPTAASRPFVSRNELQQIEEALLPQPRGQRNIFILHGAGGIGKTRLATEFARQHSKEYSAVFWIDGSTKDSVGQSIANIKERLPAYQRLEKRDNITVKRIKERQNAIDDVMIWLSQQRNDRWLMIFDNVDREWSPGTIDPDAYNILEYIPKADHGSILVTTRLPHLAMIAAGSLKVPTMSQGQSKELLETMAGRSINGWGRLVTMLDGLPLALALAGSYLRQHRISVEKYLELYQKAFDRLFKLTRSLPDYSRHILSTWQVSFNQVRDANAHAVTLLELWSCLSNTDLWLELLSPVVEERNRIPEWLYSVASDDFSFLEAVQPLLDYSLAECQDASGGYTMHPVIHNWCYSQLQNKEDMTLLATVVLGCAAPSLHDQEYWALQRRMLPHLDRIRSLVNDIPDFVIPKAKFDLINWCFNRIGDTYAGQSRTEEAEQMYQRALEGKEKAWGSNHTSTLDTVNNLGILYKDLGRMEEAEQMYQRALEGYEKAWGPNHISTLDTVNNLGNLYTKLGRMEEAEQMYQRALKGYEKAWGPNHISTLDTVNNLGNLYTKLGRMEEAEQMYQRVLEGYKKAWGPNHTSTFGIVNNLGNLYAKLGRMEEAEQMYQRALKGYEKAWGPNHTSTFGIVNNLGNLYAKLGRMEEAEQMYQRALKGYEKAWGPNHISTLDTVNNLGNLYTKLGRMEEAEQMYQRALEGCEKAWGPNHTSTFGIVNNLGNLYAKLGRMEEAEQMYQRALKGYEKAWGPNHTSTFGIVNNLGNLYAKLGRMEEAEQMYQRALKGYEKAWGPNHTSTFGIVDNLGNLYAKLGRMEEAEQMYQRALKGYEKAWGPNHTFTLRTVHNLGLLYKDLGRMEEAEQMYQRTLEGDRE